MICEVWSYEVVPGKAWKEVVEIGKKMFKFERETLGQNTYFMQSRTGKANRIIVMGFFESMAARDEYAEKLFANPEYKKITKDLDFADCVVQGTMACDYYRVIE